MNFIRISVRCQEELFTLIPLPIRPLLTMNFIRISLRRLEEQFLSPAARIRYLLTMNFIRISSKSGGAIFIDPTSDPTFTHNEFQLNSAAQGGRFS